MVSSSPEKNLRIAVLSMYLLAISLGAFILYMVGSNQKWFDSKYTLYLFLPNVEGLLPGAFVTLSGLKVGVVGHIEFYEKDNTSGIRVELKIARKYADKITPSSQARIKTMGILGDKYVDISLGNPTEPPLTPGAYLAVAPQVNFDELLVNSQEIVQQLTITTRNLANITANIQQGTGAVGKLVADNKTGQHFAAVIENLSHTVASIRSGNGILGKLVADTALAQSLNQSLQSLQAILQQIQQGKGTLGKLVTQDTLHTNVVAMLQQTDSLLIRLQEKGTTGQLLNNPALYNQLLQLTQQLNVLLKDLQENPGKYVKFELF